MDYFSLGLKSIIDAISFLNNDCKMVPSTGSDIKQKKKQTKKYLSS